MSDTDLQPDAPEPGGPVVSGQTPSSRLVMQPDGLIDVVNPDNVEYICQSLQVYRLVGVGLLEEFLVLFFKDRTSAQKKVIVKRADLYTNPLAVIRSLAAAGFAMRLSRRAYRRLMDWIAEAEPEGDCRRVDRNGLHDDIYVLNDEIFGATRQEVVSVQHIPAAGPVRQGSLTAWQQQVAAICCGNALLLFVLCLAFVPPLLGLLGLSTIGFHLFGPSSTGKTILLKMANSVWGSPARMATWDMTRTGLERHSLSCRDGLMLLDEFDQAPRRGRGGMLYLIGNSQMQRNAHNPGTEIRTLVLSSGERSVRDTLEQGGENCLGGHLMRLIDLPVARLRLTERHGHATPGGLMDALAGASSENFGEPIRVFLETLMAVDAPALRERFAQMYDAFLADTAISESAGQHRRVAKAFCLAAFAGELATEYGVTGWATGTALSACRHVFAVWQYEQDGFHSHEARDISQRVSRFIASHGQQRFVDLNLPQEEQRRLCQRRQHAGFRRELEGSSHYFVTREVFEGEILAGLDLRHAIKVLVGLEHLVRGVDGPTVPQRFPHGANKVERFYHLQVVDDVDA